MATRKPFFSLIYLVLLFGASCETVDKIPLVGGDGNILRKERAIILKVDEESLSDRSIQVVVAGINSNDKSAIENYSRARFFDPENEYRKNLLGGVTPTALNFQFPDSDPDVEGAQTWEVRLTDYEEGSTMSGWKEMPYLAVLVDLPPSSSPELQDAWRLILSLDEDEWDLRRNEEMVIIIQSGRVNAESGYVGANQ